MALKISCFSWREPDRNFGGNYPKPAQALPGILKTFCRARKSFTSEGKRRAGLFYGFFDFRMWRFLSEKRDFRRMQRGPVRR